MAHKFWFYWLVLCESIVLRFQFWQYFWQYIEHDSLYGRSTNQWHTRKMTMVWSDVQHREVASVSCFGCAWISGTVLRHAPLTSSSSRPLLVPSLSHLTPLAGGTHQPPGSTWTVMLLTSTIMPNCSDGSSVTLKNFMKYFLHQSCKERQHTEKLIQVSAKSLTEETKSFGD